MIYNYKFFSDDMWQVLRLLDTLSDMDRKVSWFTFISDEVGKCTCFIGVDLDKNDLIDAMEQSGENYGYSIHPMFQTLKYTNKIPLIVPKDVY